MTGTTSIGLATAEPLSVPALDKLGEKCRDKFAKGQADIVEAVQIAIKVRLAIEQQGEPYEGGFEAWWKTYCPGSPWAAPKLMIAGGWRETKKTGIVPAPEVIEAKVVELKQADATRKKAKRKNNRTSEKSTPAEILPPAPTMSAQQELESRLTLDQLRDGVLRLTIADKQKLLCETLGYMDAASIAVVHERTVNLAIENDWPLDGHSAAESTVAEPAVEPEPIPEPAPVTVVEISPEAPDPDFGSATPQDEEPANPIFLMWRELKPNARHRIVSWVNADCPNYYGLLDDVVTIEEAAREIRELISRTTDDAVIEEFLALTASEKV